MSNLIKALQTFGVTGNIKVYTRFNHSRVIVNGSYYGTFDDIKNTFVD